MATFKRKDKVLFREGQERRDRPGMIKTVHRKPNVGYTILFCEQRYVEAAGGAPVAETRIRSRTHLSAGALGTDYQMARAQEEDVIRNMEAFRKLEEVVDDRLDPKLGEADGEHEGKAPEAADFMPFRDLWEKRAAYPVPQCDVTKWPARLRVATFNVCHFGGGNARRDAGFAELRDEKACNLAAAISSSGCHVVVCQEVSANENLEHMEILACLLEKGGGGRSQWRWASHSAGERSGECYALLWEQHAVVRALGGDAAAANDIAAEGPNRKMAREHPHYTNIPAFPYDRNQTGTPAFRQHCKWQGDGVPARRYDYCSFGERARIPVYFELKLSGPPAAASERQLVVGTIHSACGDSVMRERQWANARSLLPSDDCGSDGQCVFVFAGDFNSGFDLAKGDTFHQTKAYDAVIETLGDEFVCCDLNAGAKGGTSLKSQERYDEIFVTRSSVCSSRGRAPRHANVFPLPKMLPGADEDEIWTRFIPPVGRTDGGFGTFKAKVFTDHLMVYIDVEFRPLPAQPPPAPVKARPKTALDLAAGGPIPLAPGGARPFSSAQRPPQPTITANSNMDELKAFRSTHGLKHVKLAGKGRTKGVVVKDLLDAWHKLQGGGQVDGDAGGAAAGGRGGVEEAAAGGRPVEGSGARGQWVKADYVAECNRHGLESKGTVVQLITRLSSVGGSGSGSGGRWIKDDWVAACKKRHLDSTGTVDELKKRLGL